MLADVANSGGFTCLHGKLGALKPGALWEAGSVKGADHCTCGEKVRPHTRSRHLNMNPHALIWLVAEASHACMGSRERGSRERYLQSHERRRRRALRL